MDMRRWARRLALIAATMALAGCGSSTTEGTGETRAFRSPSPIITLIQFSDQWASASPRWMDIGDVVFSSSFQTSYPAKPGTIQFQYDQAPGVPYLKGQIRGTGLKPNFCYQMKLAGKPGTATNGLWRGKTADTATNEAILTAARWWDYYSEADAFDTSNPTAELATTDYQNGWVAGYNYFGYFMTDANGNITGTDRTGPVGGWVTVTSDRCFHITGFKNSQFDQTGSLGTPVDPYSWGFTRNSAHYTGASVGTTDSVELFYQNENATGVFSLPAGKHSVVLMVTEESFHNNLGWGTSPSGGFWDTVWVSDWSTVKSPLGTASLGGYWLPRHGSAITFTTR
jgi:hypothetical protein